MVTYISLLSIAVRSRLICRTHQLFKRVKILKQSICAYGVELFRDYAYQAGSPDKRSLETTPASFVC